MPDSGGGIPACGACMLRRRAPYGQKFQVPVLLPATANTKRLSKHYARGLLPTYLTGYRGGSRVVCFPPRVACRASFRYGSDSLTRPLGPAKQSWH